MKVSFMIGEIVGLGWKILVNQVYEDFVDRREILKILCRGDMCKGVYQNCLVGSGVWEN